MLINKTIAFIILLLFSPLLMLIGLFIFIEDGLPIIFKQKRVGRYNTTFTIYKFRSMKRNTPNIATNLLINPELYLLKTGKFLRKLSFDELPNLFNIVKGEMIFVGPRPALYNQKKLISLRSKNGVDVLFPGITGLAQINGRDNLSLNQKVKFDTLYKNKKSIQLDIIILIKTFIKIFDTKSIKN